MTAAQIDPDTEPLRREVARFVSVLDPFPTRIVVAVSGGPDSSALLHALRNLELERTPELVAVHVNHHLRGTESDLDQEWLADFCSRLGVDLITRDGHLDPEQLRHRGVEAAARSTRYRLLDDVRRDSGADYIATAHTRSDQAETVLLRMLTGRGTWRLSGILPITPEGVVRPLLSISRDVVVAYLATHEIAARRDSSNDDTRFLRNRIRHELRPLLARWNPRIEELLADTAALELDRAAAFDELLAPVRTRLLEELPDAALIRLEESPAGLHIARTLLLEQIRRLDPDSRAPTASSLSSMTSGPVGLTTNVSATLRAVREAESVRLERIPQENVAVEFSYEISPGQTVVIDESGFAISLVGADHGDSLSSATGLRQSIQLPPGCASRFEIRNRRPGDRFRPLGMNRDKNLADFLIDRRIPSEERCSLPMLVCDDSIAWVAGVEVADQFKVRRGEGTRLEVIAERIGGER